MRGRVNPWWKPWMETIKDDIHWANKIIAMFEHKCVMCLSTENLCAHHIAPKANYPALRNDLNNGIALCQWCHLGKKNEHSAHATLKTDPERYQTLMQELMSKRRTPSMGNS